MASVDGIAYVGTFVREVFQRHAHIETIRVVPAVLVASSLKEIARFCIQEVVQVLVLCWEIALTSRYARHQVIITNTQHHLVVSLFPYNIFGFA